MTQPRSFMLSYLPAATTATRVRKTACIGLIVASSIDFLIGIFFAWATGQDSYRAASSFSPSPTFAEMWRNTDGIGVTIAVAFLLAGALLAVCTPLVYGDKPATYVAQILLVPTLLEFGAVGCILICVLAALTVDVISYLGWLRRRPREEMPKRPFI